MIYIEKRKKGEENWEKISLEKLVQDVAPVSAYLDVGEILLMALNISLTHKYETDEAEYRII